MKKQADKKENGKPATKDLPNTTEQITRQLRTPFKPNDITLRGHLEVYLKAQAEAFPIQARITRLEDEAAPFEKKMKSALAEIAKGTSEEVKCTKVINWNENRVLIIRNDTTEVVEDREPTDEDKQGNTGI